MPDHDVIISQTRKWLFDVIIGWGFCPFAQREYDNDRIYYAVIDATDVQSQLEQIILECAALNKDASRETSLLVFPETLVDFGVYLDLIDMANTLLEKQGYEGIYQLASFHPAYCFADAPPDDPANFTNRAPYPTVHILREASVERALSAFPNPENIPLRNIDVAREAGLVAMKASLAACYK